MAEREIAFRTNGDDWHEWSIDTTDDVSPRRMFVRIDHGLVTVTEGPATSSSAGARELEGSPDRSWLHVVPADLRLLAAMLDQAADKLTSATEPAGDER